MRDCVTLHEVISGELLEHEEIWALVSDGKGVQFVLREKRSITPFTRNEEVVSREKLPVTKVLARNDEVARKLQAVLRLRLP